MALFLSQYVDNPLTYSLWEGYSNPDPGYVWDKYNQWLHTPPRIYSETVSYLRGFFYVPPPRDILVLWGWTTQSVWPGWGVYAWYFDAATGEFLERADGNIFGIHYSNSVEWGDLNHLYATRNETTDCFQLNWLTFAEERAAWSISPYSWNPKRVFSHILVDKQNDKILGASYPRLDIWSGVTRGTPTLDFSMKLPTTVKDLAYENNDYGWLLLTDGQILKMDWNQYKRIEMASSIQSINSEDRDYLLAYDSYRKRLSVFRLMEDAVDGAARNRIEFYETVPKPMFLTEPVPVSRHHAGDFVKFKANIVGDMGEGFSGGMGQVSLVAPNNHGRVLSTSIVSGIAGDFNISYQAPATEETETIRLQVEHDDDITL